MMNSVYKNAYKEVYTILNYLEEDDYNKIPTEVINAIENNMNDEYEYYMNEEVDLFKQPMMEETKATLFNLFRDYLSTPEQKEKIIKMQNQDRLKLERKKEQEYSINVFEKKEKVEFKIDENLFLTVESNSLYRKIIKFFKKLFRF